MKRIFSLHLILLIGFIYIAVSLAEENKKPDTIIAVPCEEYCLKLIKNNKQGEFKKELDFEDCIKSLCESQRTIITDGIEMPYFIDLQKTVSELCVKIKSKDFLLSANAASNIGEIIKNDRQGMNADLVPIMQSAFVEIVPILIANLAAEYWGLRYHSAYALGELQDCRAVPYLIKSLKDSDASVRIHAAEALGKIKDCRAVKPLTVAATKDSNSTARHYAASALGKIGCLSAEEFLLNAFKKEQYEIIIGAYAFFVRRGEQGSEDILIRALNKSNYVDMAQGFINSGNLRLKKAAEDWAKKHNIKIWYAPPVLGTLKWGTTNPD